jgi:penicillin-binding protein 1A
VFPGGDVEDLGKPKRERVLSDAVAYEATKILKQNVLSGTGTRANIGCPAAGKTGTTDNFNDAWFVGFTPDFAASAWVGYPNALLEMRSVHGISVAGGTFPAEIWNKFMQVAKANRCEDFPKPTTAIRWSPFFGKYSTQGSYSRRGAYSYGNGGGDTQGGGYSGYDPRLYNGNPTQDNPSGGGRDKGGGKKGGGKKGGGKGGGKGDGTGGAGVR